MDLKDDVAELLTEEVPAEAELRMELMALEADPETDDAPDEAEPPAPPMTV